MDKVTQDAWGTVRGTLLMYCPRADLSPSRRHALDVIDKHFKASDNVPKLSTEGRHALEQIFKDAPDCTAMRWGMDENKCPRCSMIWDRAEIKPPCPKEVL
jgi:hypothetical protein